MAAVRDRIDGWRNDRFARAAESGFTVRVSELACGKQASVLHHSETQAVLQSIAEKKCLLTTPSLLSRGTQRRFSELRRGHPPDTTVGLKVSLTELSRVA